MCVWEWKYFWEYILQESVTGAGFLVFLYFAVKIVTWTYFKTKRDVLYHLYKETRTQNLTQGGLEHGQEGSEKE